MTALPPFFDGAPPHVAFYRPAYRYSRRDRPSPSRSRNLSGGCMMPRTFAVATESLRAVDTAFRASSERASNSPEGMRETAQGLRQRASQMSDSFDRDAMLRLAAKYEGRAKNRDRHS